MRNPFSLFLLPYLAAIAHANPFPFVAEEPFLERERGGSANLIDFDGDGALDLVYVGVGADSNSAFQTWRNNGTLAWEKASVTRAGSAIRPIGFPSLGDFDGNAKPDLLLFRNEPVSSAYAYDFVLPDLSPSGAAGLKADAFIRLDSIPGAIPKGIFYGTRGTVALRTSTSPTEYKARDVVPAGFDSLRTAIGQDGSLLIADFNNDGESDAIAIPGYQHTLDGTWYRASNPSGYVDKRISDLRIWSGTAMAGDWDNDGDLDFVVCGMQQVSEFNANRWYFFENTGDGFIQTKGPGEAPGYGFALLGDVDRDGDLDLVSGGSYATTQLFRNTIAVKNEPPSTPAGPALRIDHDTLYFSWSTSTDDHTPARGITYNLRMGTGPGKTDTYWPGANAATGTLLVQHFGNCGSDTLVVRGKPKPGMYFWAVQAIDNAYAASGFTAEGSFEVKADGSVALRGTRDGSMKGRLGNGVRLRSAFAGREVTADGRRVRRTSRSTDAANPRR